MSEPVYPVIVGKSKDGSQLLCLRSANTQHIIGPGGDLILVWAIPGLMVKPSPTLCIAPEIRIECAADYISLQPTNGKRLCAKYVVYFPGEPRVISKICRVYGLPRNCERQSISENGLVTYKANPGLGRNSIPPIFFDVNGIGE